MFETENGWQVNEVDDDCSDLKDSAPLSFDEVSPFSWLGVDRKRCVIDTLEEEEENDEKEEEAEERGVDEEDEEEDEEDKDEEEDEEDEDEEKEEGVSPKDEPEVK